MLKCCGLYVVIQEKTEALAIYLDNVLIAILIKFALCLKIKNGLINR